MQGCLPFFRVDCDSRNKSKLIFLNALSVVLWFEKRKRKQGICIFNAESIGYFQELDE